MKESESIARPYRVERERGSRDTPERPRRDGSVPQAVHTRAISSVRPMSLVLNSAARGGVSTDVEVRAQSHADGCEAPSARATERSRLRARHDRLTVHGKCRGSPAAPDGPRRSASSRDAADTLARLALLAEVRTSSARTSSHAYPTRCNARAAPSGLRSERGHMDTPAVHSPVPSNARRESEQGRASQLTSPHECGRSPGQHVGMWCRGSLSLSLSRRPVPLVERKRATRGRKRRRA